MKSEKAEVILKSEKAEVIFIAKRSKSKFCVCDGCMNSCTVTKIQIPTSLYYDGRHLTTHYNPRWYCDDCRDKLIYALQNPTPEE